MGPEKIKLIFEEAVAVVHSEDFFFAVKVEILKAFLQTSIHFLKLDDVTRIVDLSLKNAMALVLLTVI